MNFDDVERLADDLYEGAYFFQSFHHCLRPWELIETLADKLKKDAVIAFSGEPVQDRWWLNWGLRLDMESVFVARQHGWFESGWSLDFLRRCFERSGFQLLLFNGGYLTGHIGVASRSPERLAEVRMRAARMGIRETDDCDVSPERFGSVVGVPDNLAGRPAYRQDKGPGTLIYGPYVRLRPGAYRLSFIARRADAGVADELDLDVITDIGAAFLLDEKIAFAAGETEKVIERRIATDHIVKNVEIRVHARGPSQWTVTIPEVSTA